MFQDCIGYTRTLATEVVFLCTGESCCSMQLMMHLLSQFYFRKNYRTVRCQVFLTFGRPLDIHPCRQKSPTSRGSIFDTLVSAGYLEHGSYPLPHWGLGLSDRNIGKNVIKSLPCGLCLPSWVSGRQRMQDGLTTEEIQEESQLQNQVFFVITLVTSDLQYYRIQFHKETPVFTDGITDQPCDSV